MYILLSYNTKFSNNCVQLYHVIVRQGVMEHAGPIYNHMGYVETENGVCEYIHTDTDSYIGTHIICLSGLFHQYYNLDHISCQSW